MSYFTTRPRGYSKPTKEELKALSVHLSERSENELKYIIEAAVNESAEVTRVIMKVMNEAHFVPSSSHFQPVQQQPLTLCNSTNDNGLPTPNDTSEDSEMSGTENAPPPPQPQIPFFSQTPPRRSNKRKSLADRDDNIPSISPRSFSTVKKRRADGQIPPTRGDSHDSRTDCGNCGRSVPKFCWNDSNACVYHPGNFEREQVVSLATSYGHQWDRGTWSCCQGSLTARGCLATKHRDVDTAGPGREGSEHTAKGQQTQFCVLHRSGVLPLVQ